MVGGYKLVAHSESPAMGNVCFGAAPVQEPAPKNTPEKHATPPPVKPGRMSSGGLSSMFRGNSQTDKQQNRRPGPDKPKPMRRRSSITESFSTSNEYVIKLLHDCLQVRKGTQDIGIGCD